MDYIFRKAGPEDIPQIAALMKAVYDAMPDKSLFVCDDEAFVRRVVMEDGFAVMAVPEDSGADRIGVEAAGAACPCGEAGSRPAAVLLVFFPGSGKENLGRDIGLPESELPGVVHMDSAVVLGEHRGHHLEYRMLLEAEHMLDPVRYPYIMATVAPENAASLHSLEKAGLRIAVTKEKYCGVLRHLLLKERRNAPDIGF